MEKKRDESLSESLEVQRLFLIRMSHHPKGFLIMLAQIHFKGHFSQFLLPSSG